jgi:hypothetical protein
MSIDEYGDIEVTVFAKASEGIDYVYGSSDTFEYTDRGEYNYTTEVSIAGDLGEYVDNIKMKIKYEANNITY